MENEKHVSKAVISRLPRYYRTLRQLAVEGVGRISSKDLAAQMDLTASQIRQDLSCFGGF
ncbi:MAG TPA: redox-sensing transcriptional repressor Rex, partial [Clostridiales bacterium]|nr:redox-sensing transcriptional repressor Rex [Clostridiales bacterium]